VFEWWAGVKGLSKVQGLSGSRSRRAAACSCSLLGCGCAGAAAHVDGGVAPRVRVGGSVQQAGLWGCVWLCRQWDGEVQLRAERCGC
jgi:hypothetical protein